MSPALSTERVRPPGPAISTGDLVDMVIGLVLGILVIVPVASQLNSPPVVPEVKVVNPTEYDFHVAVRGGADTGVLGLGAVERGEDATFQQVLDQGGAWVFQFQYGGRIGGELRTSREELERNEWTVTIPEASGERLAEIGVSPSA